MKIFEECSCKLCSPLNYNLKLVQSHFTFTMENFRHNKKTILYVYSGKDNLVSPLWNVHGFSSYNFGCGGVGEMGAGDRGVIHIHSHEILFSIAWNCLTLMQFYLFKITSY